MSPVPDSAQWRSLYRDPDPAKVESVWLALRSMEYPARLADRDGPIDGGAADGDQFDGSHRDDQFVDERSPEEWHVAPSSEDEGRVADRVEVYAEHLDQLHDVVEAILEEQSELDLAIAERMAARRRLRLFAGLVVLAVAALLVSGLVSAV